MTEAKKKILEAKGYKVTDSAEWLGLSREEAQIVDMRVALAQELERVRKAKGITQAELAKRIGTKQSGVARMLNNPDTSTMDNLIKALIALRLPPACCCAQTIEAGVNLLAALQPEGRRRHPAEVGN